MAYSSQQPSQYAPELSTVSTVSKTWTTTGNTNTVIDESVHPSSVVAVNPTSIPAGFWKVVVAQGSFTITSSDSESAGLGFNYKIL